MARPRSGGFVSGCFDARIGGSARVPLEVRPDSRGVRAVRTQPLTDEVAGSVPAVAGPFRRLRPRGVRGGGVLVRRSKKQALIAGVRGHLHFAAHGDNGLEDFGVLRKG